jgi:hypothetical protein
MLPLDWCIIQPGRFADERLVLSGKFNPVRDASNHCHLARRKDDRAAIRTATRQCAQSGRLVVRLTPAIVRAWIAVPRSTRRNARSARIRIFRCRTDGLPRRSSNAVPLTKRVTRCGRPSRSHLDRSNSARAVGRRGSVLRITSTRSMDCTRLAGSDDPDEPPTGRFSPPRSANRPRPASPFGGSRIPYPS